MGQQRGNNTVLSARVTEDRVAEVDALAREFGVTRSYVISTLLLWALNRQDEVFELNRESAHRRRSL